MSLLADGDGIAIIGVACRFPGAADKESYWDNQLARRNFVSEVPAHRWRWQDVHGDPSRGAAKSSSKWGAFLTDVDRFDPTSFGISPSEAEVMDPQHRLFLKAVWEAILDAGYAPGSAANTSLGVFAGVQFQEYQQLLIDKGILSARVCTGNAQTMLANRVSYLLDVNGPSESIDTSCSSSLVAVHHAVGAIRTGACDWAIAGGANLMFVPDVHIMGSQLGVLSPTGVCRPLDAHADGYVRGEGVGVVLLKLLRRALADDDHIYGVIRGTGMNHGGRAVSLTAPNASAQAEVMRRALADARVGPSDVSYVEMHATGTVVGDPTEFEAIRGALGPSSESAAVEGRGLPRCGLASVKSNIGHLEAASGIAGLINATLAVSRARLPGMASFTTPNPKIELEGTRFYINATSEAWPGANPHDARCALVNSFGFGGSNCSVVVQSYEDALRADRDDDVATEHLVPISVSHPALFPEYARRLATAVEWLASSNTGGEVRFRDVVQTLRAGRQALLHRMLLRVRHAQELARALRAIADGRASEFVVEPGDPALAAHLSTWLQGQDVEWPTVPGARRVSLPVPPWHDQSYWHDALSAGTKACQGDDAGYVYLEPAWKPCASPLVTTQTGSMALVIGDDVRELNAWRDQVVKADSTARAMTLLVGDETLKEQNADGISRVFRAEFERLRAAKLIPDVIVVLDAGDRPVAHSDCSARRFGAMRDVFALTRELLGCFFREHIALQYVMTGKGAAVHGGALSAFFKSVYLENSRLSFNLFQIESGAGLEWRDVVAKAWGSEGARQPRMLAWRADGWHAYQLAGSALQRDGTQRSGRAIIEDGVYFVAGGTGELGKRIAADLSGSYRAKVVLIGRSAEAEKGEVIDYVRSHAADPTNVAYLQCDVTSLPSVQQAVRNTVDLFGRINGVISLVTDHRDAFLFNKSWNDFDAVAGGKVAGTINLDHATADLDLDWFALFSSQAALGMAGGADYAFGCEFQNQYARYRNNLVRDRARRGKTLSINWSRWQWDKHATEQFDQWALSLGYEFIDVRNGMACFERLLESDLDNVFALHGRQADIIASLDLEHGLLQTSASAQRWRDQPKAAAHNRIEESLKDLDHAQLLKLAAELDIVVPPAQPDVKQSAVSPISVVAGDVLWDEVKTALGSVLGRQLKIDRIEDDADLASLGVDSIIAVDVIIALEEKFSVELNPTWLFEFPTISLLARQILPLVEQRATARQ